MSIIDAIRSTLVGPRSTVPEPKKPTLKQAFYKFMSDDEIDPPQPTITPPVEQELIDNSANKIELESKIVNNSIVRILKIQLPLTKPEFTEFRIGDKITTMRYTSDYDFETTLHLSEPIHCTITDFTTEGATPSSIKVKYSKSYNIDTGKPIFKDDTIQLNTKDLLLRAPPFRSNPAVYGALLWTKIQKVSPSSKGGAKRKRSKSAKRRKRNHRRHSRKHTK